MPAPDHSAAGGNGSGPPRDSRTRVRELVARERATGIRLHARDVAAAAGIMNAAPMGCSAPSGRGASALTRWRCVGCRAAGCPFRWSGRAVRLSSFIGRNLIYDAGRSFGYNRENRLKHPGQ